jgi:hypothetical protein
MHKNRFAHLKNVGNNVISAVLIFSLLFMSVSMLS